MSLTRTQDVHADDDTRSPWAVTAASAVAALVVVLAFGAWEPLLVGYRQRLLLPVLAVALLLVLLGAGMRAWGRGPVATVGAQALALVLTLTHLWAPGTSLLGVVPTGATLGSMAALLQQAVLDSRAYAAPVPTDAVAFPTLCLALGAVALLLADLLAAGLRRPALVALPALVVLTVPVVVLQDPLPGHTLVLTALAYAALLAVEGGEASVPGRWAAAGVVALVAVTASGVLTPLVPRTGGVVDLSGRQSGEGELDLRNPFADLRRDLVRGGTEPVLRVRTQDPDPRYIRTTVLDVYDGDAWRPGERDLPARNVLDGQVPAPFGADAAGGGMVYDYVFASQGLNSTWLPLPYPARSGSISGDWRYDEDTLDVVSMNPRVTTSGQAWRATGQQPTWTPDELAGAAPPSSGFLDTWTALPSDFPAEVGRLAARVTRGQDSSYEQAVALQDWFRRDGGFRYSTRTPAGSAENDLQSFLRRGPDGRVGYCEQFAASMAVMARSLGIPARVSVGFLRGSQVQGRGDTGLDAATWTFAPDDLHAWPELWFAGAGWVRFEPTPAARTGAAPPWSAPGSGAGAEQPSTTPTPSASAAPSTAPPSAAPTQPPGAQESSDAGGLSTPALVAMTLLVLVLAIGLLLLLPAWLRGGRRRRQLARLRGEGPGLAEVAWAEVTDEARDLGVRWPPSATVRETAAVLGEHVEADPARRDVLVLADAVEEARFGPSSGQGEEEGAVRTARLQAVESVTSSLREGADPRARRRARWWPTSVWRRP